MRLGIGSWTYPWSVGVPGYPPAKPLDALGLLQRAKELGAGVVQICDNMDLAAMSPEELRAIRREAGKLGITLQAGTRGVEPEHLLRFLEISKLLGADLLRTLTDARGLEPDADTVVAQLKAVLPEFEKAGVSLAIENHDRFTSPELVRIVQAAGSPFLGVCLDTANSFGALECPAETVRTLAPYAINLHVKDFGIERVGCKMGFEIAGRPAGQGRLDLDMVLDALHRNGRSPDAILEQWPPFESSMEQSVRTECEWAREGFEYLKKHIGGN